MIELSGPADDRVLSERVNSELPPGITITLVEEVASARKRGRLVESQFLITLNKKGFDESDLERFLQSDYFGIDKKNKKGKHEINVRPLVKSMRLDDPRRLTLALEHPDGPGIKPADLIKGIFHLEDVDIVGLQILKTGQVLA